jgi:hypothetical protein
MRNISQPVVLPPYVAENIVDRMKGERLRREIEDFLLDDEE